MGMENYSLSDIAAVTDGTRDGMFGGNGIWFLALLFLFGGGFGGGWGGGRGQAATTEDVASGFNFSALQGKTNDILAEVNNNNQVLGNAICQLGYQTAQNFAQVERQMAECCCNIERNIDGVNYNVVSQAAAINANTTAGIQKILDAITGNRMADMQAQINQLQLNAALCGVVRYPTATTYATTCNPFFGGYNVGCGCANI